MEYKMDIETAVKSLESSLLNLPNVTAVSVGNKNGKEIINVYVTEKIPESKLNKTAIIPKSFETFEINVCLERRQAMRNMDELDTSEDDECTEHIDSSPSTEILSQMKLIICSAN